MSSSDTYGSIQFTRAPERRVSVIRSVADVFAGEQSRMSSPVLMTTPQAQTHTSYMVSMETDDQPMFMEENEPRTPPPRRVVSEAPFTTSTSANASNASSIGYVPTEEDYAYPPPRQAVSASASLAAILGNFEVETPQAVTLVVEHSQFTSPFINGDMGGSPGSLYERTAADDADPYESLSSSSIPSFAESSLCSTIDDHMDQDGNESVASQSSFVSEEQVHVVQSAINNMDLHSRLGIMESLRRLSQGQGNEAAHAMAHRTSDTWVRDHVLKASAEHGAAVAAAERDAVVAAAAATKASPTSSTNVYVGFSQSFEPSNHQFERAQGPYTFTE